MNNSELYNDLLDLYLNNFETSDGNYPTSAWLSGMFKKVQDFRNIEHFLDDEKILPEQREKMRKIKLFKEFAIKHGLIKPTINGFFKPTDKGSNFIQSISSNIEQYKKFNAHRTPYGRTPEYKKLWYDFVAAVNSDDKEWASSLSKPNSDLLKIYSELTPKEFTVLKGLIKNGKARTKIIKNIYDQSPDMFDKLVHSKMVNLDGSVNNKLLTSFFTFLSDSGYSRLKNFNKEIAYSIDRSTSDNALSKNYLERQLSDSPRSNELGRKVSTFIKNIDEESLNKIKKLFKDSKISKDIKDYLIKNEIIDTENTLTIFGKMLRYVLTSTKNIDDFKDNTYNFKYKSPEERENHPVPNKLLRKPDLASNRKRSFKDFIKR